MQCKHLIDKFVSWYESRILGCTIEQWHEIQSGADLDAWLDEREAHAHSELGFYIRFAREIGLDNIGKGHNNFLSFGQLDLPKGSMVKGRCRDSNLLIPAGFVTGNKIEPFNQEKISEHTSSSWYSGEDGSKHPFVSRTNPYATGKESEKYSWIKAPRYNGMPAETGPLAEMMVSGHPLFTDLAKRSSPSAFVRELARLVRPLEILPAMKKWIMKLDPNEEFYIPPENISNGDGFGLTQASRGALGHWVRIEDKKIQHYQIITPTAWNGSPRDSSGMRGPWEEALIGTPIKDPNNPVELGHIIRSFDPCLVCAVHAIQGEKRKIWKI
jgi:hydrogenase large subunit